MILARLGIAVAICTTMYFNGTYGYSLGDGAHHPWAMLALAVAIDLCKCSFLPAAAITYRHGHRIGALVLILLFLPCFAFSTFAGYSSILSNRMLSSADATQKQQARAIVQARYDQASADLQTARSLNMWKATGGCTSMRRRVQRAYCQSIQDMQLKLTSIERQLTDTSVVYANPEIIALAGIVGLPVSILTFWVAAIPAVILELIAGLGLFAITARTDPKPLRTPFLQRVRQRLARDRKQPQATAQVAPVPTTTAPQEKPVQRSPLVAPKLKWSTALVR